MVSTAMPIREMFFHCLVLSALAVACIGMFSASAAAVTDEEYFIDIYLAAEPEDAVEQDIKRITAHGVPDDIAPQLYREAKTCEGSVLFRHTTRNEITYLRTHNDAIRLRAGKAPPTQDIKGIIQRSAKQADAGARARCLWYKADMKTALNAQQPNIVIREFSCRHVKDTQFACTYWLEDTDREGSREDKRAYYRWDDGWKVAQD